jgi:hypothetical protein
LKNAAPKTKGKTGIEKGKAKADFTCACRPELRRYFFDTEFVDTADPGSFTTSFISIGLVGEDGKKEYHGVNLALDVVRAMQNKWVNEHVVKKLPPAKEWKDISVIRQEILDMIEPARKVEFWAKNGTYDNYILCRIFGGMGNLYDTLRREKGIEKVEFRDGNELRRAYGKPKLPYQPADTQHHALHDAKYERKVFAYYSRLAEKARTIAPKPAL